MKRLLVFTFVFYLYTALSISIPKKLMGQYKAEVPAFEFEDNGHTVQASSYNLLIILKEDYMWYKTDMLELYGEYTNLVEKGPLVDVDIAVSNDLSIKFDFGITYNKKTGAVSIKGLKGVPEMSLNKKEIQISKNK